MSDPQSPGPDPEPPRPPGTPELDLDIPIDQMAGEQGRRPADDDVTDDEVPEPPD